MRPQHFAHSCSGAERHEACFATASSPASAIRVRRGPETRSVRGRACEGRAEPPEKAGRPLYRPVRTRLRRRTKNLVRPTPQRTYPHPRPQPRRPGQRSERQREGSGGRDAWLPRQWVHITGMRLGVKRPTRINCESSRRSRIDSARASISQSAAQSARRWPADGPTGLRALICLHGPSGLRSSMDGPRWTLGRRQAPCRSTRTGRLVRVQGLHAGRCPSDLRRS